MLPLQELPPTQSLAAGAGLLFLYIVCGAIYRLYFSPIAKFPGPKLAALTLWYEFYYDVIKPGRYTWEIGKMHEKYGPIVRINPYELHINDPDYYDELYCGASKSRRDKWDWPLKMFGKTTSVFATISHDHHRVRRAALSPYFSTRSVTRLEPLIQSLIQKLCARFRDLQQSGEPVNLEGAYSALTMDIIMEYAFARSYNYLEKKNFALEWIQLLKTLCQTAHLNKQFGWLMPLMEALPGWFVMKLNPPIMHLINFKKDVHAQVHEVINRKDDNSQTAAHPTIFRELLNSDLPPEEKTFVRLCDEGVTVVSAGAVTTANFLTMTSFHVIANPPILQTLKAELATAMPDSSKLLPLAKLETLPYLSAVVLEGFRVSYGVCSRSQRVCPDEPLIFHEWVIPPGTPVSMTSLLIHDNSSLFPEPKVFRPERWLKGDGSKEQLSKYLVNFSKGTRACLGINLAYAEIYLTMAAVFRRCDFELFETTREDVDVIHDFINPTPRLDSKGVRVLIK